MRFRQQLADRNELVESDDRAKDLIKGSKELIDKLTALEEKLHNPKAKVTYDIFAAKGGAKLYSQYAFLYGSAMEGDGAPTQGMREVYADLALETSQRAGMWVKQPDPEWTLVGGWIQKALELAQEGSLAQGNALAALADIDSDEAAARSALAIAERLGDLELRCIMLSVLSDIALAARDFDRACALMDQVVALLPALRNPDACSVTLHSALFVYLRSGNLGQAEAASTLVNEEIRIQLAEGARRLSSSANTPNFSEGESGSFISLVNSPVAGL